MHDPPTIRPDVLVHQEGVLALCAFVGLFFSERGLIEALAPRGSLIVSLGSGTAAGLGVVVLAWLVRDLPPLVRLERWQRRVIGGWTTTDAFVVAIISGFAEEALMRALLQPIIGLVAASLLFAILHVVPDQRLWAWPVIALGAGIVLGLVFENWGFPAAAAAHVVINLFGLLRLRRSRQE